MPSKSKSQQRLMGMVHAYQKGELKNASKQVKDMAKSMKKKDAKKFAKTKHKGLPERKGKLVNETLEEFMNENGPFDVMHTQAPAKAIALKEGDCPECWGTGCKQNVDCEHCNGSGLAPDGARRHEGDGL